MYCNVIQYCIVEVSVLFRQIFAVINSQLWTAALINGTLSNPV